VVVLYAGTHGFLDPIPVADVRRYEHELLDWFRARHGSVLDDIRSSGAVRDEDGLRAALEDFAGQFTATETDDAG